MASIKTIKRRIKSAKNIKQITRAMEMVSASKMKRAQEKALQTRPYSTKLKEILSQLDEVTDIRKHPLLKKSEAIRGSICVILISSNRGLCGALNTNLFRATEEFKQSLSEKYPHEVLNFDYITVGKKSREYVLKTGQTLYAEFSDMSERPSFEDILPISRLVIDEFLSEKFAQVHIVYTGFITTLSQEVNFFRLLPIESERLEKELKGELTVLEREYIFEPHASQVLDWLLPHYLEIQVYQTLLEAQASEHSARMVAMRSASDNANEIISDLTLVYNKKRQQSITNEIADLITSRMAISQGA